MSLYQLIDDRPNLHFKHVLLHNSFNTNFIWVVSLANVIPWTSIHITMIKNRIIVKYVLAKSCNCHVIQQLVLITTAAYAAIHYNNI